jgi:hypothetical protein
MAVYRFDYDSEQTAPMFAALKDHAPMIDRPLEERFPTGFGG